MKDEVWVELDRDAGKVLWAELADRYQFRASTNPDRWPAIVEPAPSVVWDLGPVFTGDYLGEFHAGSHDIATLGMTTTLMPEAIRPAVRRRP